MARQILGHNNDFLDIRERTFNRLFPDIFASKSNQAPLPPPPQYLSSYIPPLLQALHYFTEMLTYETSEMTTIEPPFNLSTVASDVTSRPTTIQTKPETWFTQTTTKPTQRPTQTTMNDEYVQETSTQRPTQRPTQTWWRPPETTTTKRTTTRKTTWWSGPKPSSTTTTTRRSTHSTTSSPWWVPTTTTRRSTHSTTSSPWWVPTTTMPTTTKKPWTTTKRPYTSTPWWAQTQVTTSRKPVTASWSATTQAHMPGIYMPQRPWYLGPAPSSVSSTRPSSSITNNNNNYILSDPIVIRPSSGQTSQTSNQVTTRKPNDEFFMWFLQSKPQKTKYDFQFNMNLLDPFPKKLLEDIAKEPAHQPAIMDEDNVDEFRKIYDDSWAVRYKPLTGKKKTPPTKPYVEMLLLYDLLKKDAKRLAFNKYNGYSDEILEELNELSKRSSERQLHTLLSKVLEQNEFEGPRTKTRIEGLIAGKFLLFILINNFKMINFSCCFKRVFHVFCSL
uniref:CSON004876 protein n=1 Tax=Culicoides sonorensis TaxID=179676 RepID=A0A336MPA5_CULSO